MLPISSKDFAKLDCDAIFEFMIENNLLSSTESGVKPTNSCANQLISITLNVFRASDGNPSIEPSLERHLTEYGMKFFCIN